MNGDRKSGAELERRSEEALAGELARWVRPDAVSAPDLGLLAADLDAELAKERGPSAFLRSRSTPQRMGLTAGSLLGLALLTWATSARADLAVYPWPRMLLLLGVMVTWFLASSWLALWPLSRPAPPTALRRAVIAFSPLVLLALYSLPVAHSDHPASVPEQGTLFARALPCLGIGLAIALAMYVLLRALDRGGMRATLLMATAGGLAANLVLQLHCAITAPAHMLLGHLGAVVLILGGVALADRLRA